MPYFNIVAQTNEDTVVTEYEPVKQKANSYQSEAELEKEFIRMLRKKICGLTFCLGFERWQSITPEEGIHGRA